MFQRFIIEALTNLCGHFRTTPLRINRLIGFLYGILHTRCFGFALCYLFIIAWYILLCMCMNNISKRDDRMKNKLSISRRCRVGTTWEQRQARRIWVIKLHDIFVDSESCRGRGWNFNYCETFSVKWIDHPAINWNSITFRTIFEGSKVISHWSCNYVFTNPCLNSMREFKTSSHQKIVS